MYDIVCLSVCEIAGKRCKIYTELCIVDNSTYDIYDIVCLSVCETADKLRKIYTTLRVCQCVR